MRYQLPAPNFQLPGSREPTPRRRASGAAPRDASSLGTRMPRCDSGCGRWALGGGSWRRSAACVALIVLSFVAAGCGGSGSETEPASSRALAEVALPELARVDAPVQAQIREKYAAVTKMLAAGTPAGRELGTAFGEYGMLLDATEFFDAAEPAYLNAQRLLPDDVRWPYYLGHLYRAQGDTASAMAAFRRALELKPSDAPALIWLGRLHLDAGDAAEAERLFERARAQSPGVIAAQVGIGQAALARQDYARAAQVLEAALASHPSATSIYAPLAVAYRGLGQTGKAESLASRWKNTEVALPDPLREELNMSVRSGLALELRGIKALERGDYAAAATHFREGLTLAPEGSGLSRSLRHKLGTALALTGQTDEAVRAFEETVRLAPPDALDEAAAKASYSLGVMLASAGETARAIERLTAALRFSPNYLEARLALGNVHRTSGRPAASLEHYEDALRIDPRSAEARLYSAMALVRLRRFADAKRWLEEGLRARPDHPELTNALARLLAAAPDPAVRDAPRALSMTQQLAATVQTVEVGETLAMALAATRQFAEAASVQRDLIASARGAAAHADADRLAVNLRRYESGQPAPTPWPDDHPVHTIVR